MANKLKPCTQPKGKHSWELVRNVEECTASLGARGARMTFSAKGLYRCTACPERKLGRSGWPEEIEAAKARNEARKAKSQPTKD